MESLSPKEFPIPLSETEAFGPDSQRPMDRVYCGEIRDNRNVVIREITQSPFGQHIQTPDSTDSTEWHVITPKSPQFPQLHRVLSERKPVPDQVRWGKERIPFPRGKRPGERRRKTHPSYEGLFQPENRIHKPREVESIKILFARIERRLFRKIIQEIRDQIFLGHIPPVQVSPLLAYGNPDGTMPGTFWEFDHDKGEGVRKNIEDLRRKALYAILNEEPLTINVLDAADSNGTVGVNPSINVFPPSSRDRRQYYGMLARLLKGECRLEDVRRVDL